MEENYNVAAVANDVLSAPSQEYSDIQQELTYQFTLWSNYYASQQMDLVKLEAVGNQNNYLSKTIFYKKF